ncbi:hypothetical protein GALMADRAFT_69458 [Galerina marginata CBS 339.88]|uniref:Spindle pole body component n=1 Tax=Galerina marginata (strain CBS 339.88) TaxID=685588 RepID=A0A067SVU1_GALM3|nr:hypothetical protein GALMADRAFT_69458 [Galerina marginata CBS 339.88]
MWHTFVRQSDFNNEFDLPPLDDLPRVMPYFFVPPMENKPQNPIMENLKLEKMNTSIPPRRLHPPLLPKELSSWTLEIAHTREQERSPNTVEELWRNANIRRLGVNNGLLSWDRLRHSHYNAASSTPFLSEQGDVVSTSARYYVQPRLYNALDSTTQVTQKDLLLSLKKTVLGLSSQYHVWDPMSERFVQVGTENSDRKGFILIDGKDEVVSGSFIQRFLKIGTLLRRLELFLLSLRTSSVKDGPTVHSLAHALSTTLDFLRDVLTKCPPSEQQIRATSEDFSLLAIWSHYASYENLMDALVELYGRDYNLSPEEYRPLDLSPVPLLSHIYDHMKLHFERQSPTIVRAVLAFLLTLTSQEYLQEVAQSVGFEGQLSQNGSIPGRKSDGLDMDDEEIEPDIFDLLDKIGFSYPSFFPLKVLYILPAAQKSLVLLQVAQPDFFMPFKQTSKSSIRWLWMEDEITAAWNDLPLPANILRPLHFATTPSTLLPFPTIAHNPDLLEFYIFDLEPGGTVSSPSLQVKNDSATVLDTFIKRFPETLPTITPTLPELTSLIFKDLMEHSASLSSSLLSLILNSTGILNFPSHLIILRSFLLVASPAFKSRLLNALFSDAGEYETNDTAHSMSVQSLRRKSGKAPKEGNQPWAVGLSPNLLERETWPPVGADLSFFLRTVIVDSLDTGRETEDGAKREQVVEEAGWRLGFAIRDLPTGPGRDKWLDPLCIALDFLYMDYKPPHPLEILISPDILSKYQRMFTFILRLFRVESALKSLFRMSTHRTTANFLFPTLIQARNLLLHFRFLAQTFVSNLAGYVFDTAIGGNFDPFIEQLSADKAGQSSQDQKLGNTTFSDVFELAQRHSALMDDILSACLLRSGQRGVGDLLRHSMELVLEFTIVVGELHRGRIQEYQAAPLVEELFRKFCTKMRTLTKVLKGLVDKGPSSMKFSLEIHNDGSRRPVGGLEALYHLLIRIDFTDWWSKERKNSREEPSET